MAIDLLSILAMSSEAERVFSLTKKTINQGRWSLKPDTIEARGTRTARGDRTLGTGGDQA